MAEENKPRELQDCKMSSFEAFEVSEGRNTICRKRSDVFDRGNYEIQVNLTEKIISDCLRLSNNPVLLCSFGKDSMVILHMILKVKKIPVIFWKEPFFQDKFSFAQKTAVELGLDVYDYPPESTDFLSVDDYFEIFNMYDVGGGSRMNLFTGIRKPNDDDKRVLCAVKDMLYRPTCSGYNFKWDCIFHGHKMCDNVHVGKDIAFNYVHTFGNGILTMPLRDWSHEDVWTYTIENNVPCNLSRYENRIEKNNSDMFPACYACLDCKNEGKKVFCRELNKEIDFHGRNRIDSLALAESITKTVYKGSV